MLPNIRRRSRAGDKYVSDSREEAVVEKGNGKKRALVKKIHQHGAKGRWNAGIDKKTGATIDGKSAFLKGDVLNDTQNHNRNARSRIPIDNTEHAVKAFDLDEDSVVGPTLAKNDKLMKVIVSVQDLTRWFTELSDSLDGRNFQLGRILSKIRVKYINCFERLLQVLSEFHTDKEVYIKGKIERMVENEDELRKRISDLSTENHLLKSRISSQELVGYTQNDRLQELENEVDYLRGMLRSEKEALLHRVRTPPPIEKRSEATSLIKHGSLLTDADDQHVEISTQVTTQSRSVGLELDEPLHMLETIVQSFESQEIHNDQILSNMHQLLDAAKLNAKRMRQADALFMAQKLRPHEVTIVDTEEHGTMTCDMVTGFGAGTLDIMHVTPGVTRQTMWLRAFNFARCPRCKIDLAKPIKASELMNLGRFKDAPRKTVAVKKRNSDAEKGSGAVGRKGSLVDDSGVPLSPQARRGRSSGVTPLGDDGEEPDEFEDMLEDETVLDPEIIAAVLNNNKNGFVFPQSAYDFMVNLPSGIIETPPREFEWLLEKIDDIYNKKLEADNTDRNDGLRLQPLGEFVIEQLLFNHGLRRLAEVHLFDLLASLKHHLRKKHPKMVIFARFLDAYYSTKTPEKLDNINILQVYLIVRDQLLHITKNIVNEDKQDQDGQQVDQKLLHQDGQTYIPIEHAVVTMRYTYLSFLPPRKASLYVKTIESMAGVQAIFTSPDGKVVQEFRPPNKASTGDRMTVRIAMRNAMLTKIDAEEEEPAPKKKKGKKGRKEKPIEPEPEEAGVQKQVFVDMDLVLGKLIKVLISRERYIEEKLKQMFIEGDTDGDGVLSFAEFQDITAQGNSDLSQRKILRMFREAVTRGGPEASLSLLPETFQAVGKDYDLIPLCDMEKLRRVTVSRQSQRSDKQ